MHLEQAEGHLLKSLQSNRPEAVHWSDRCNAAAHSIRAGALQLQHSTLWQRQK